MSNPLFNAMTQLASNNIQPNNAFSLLSNMLNGGKSDAMIVNMAMGMLQNQNPEMAQRIKQAMNSGQNPEVLIRNEISKMNPQQVAQVKQMLAQSGAPREILNQLG